MPAVLPFVPAIVGGISAIGGLIQGNRQAKQNQQLIGMQDRQLAQVAEMANRMVNQTSRAEYEGQANRDVNAAMQDVFGAMASRGMGRSTAAMTAVAGAAGQIRSGYGQKYLSDRLSALQSAGGMLSGVASTPRMGYDSDPFAGFRSGLSGLSSGAAYYQANGWPGRGGMAAPQMSATGPYMPGSMPSGFQTGMYR